MIMHTLSKSPPMLGYHPCLLSSWGSAWWAARQLVADALAALVALKGLAGTAGSAAMRKGRQPSFEQSTEPPIARSSSKPCVCGR